MKMKDDRWWQVFCAALTGTAAPFNNTMTILDGTGNPDRFVKAARAIADCAMNYCRKEEEKATRKASREAARKAGSSSTEEGSRQEKQATASRSSRRHYHGVDGYTQGTDEEGRGASGKDHTHRDEVTGKTAHERHEDRFGPTLINGERDPSTF